jgi:hypothetical protein
VSFCTEEILEEDLEDTYNIRQVNSCVVGMKSSWRNEFYNIKEERVVRKCILYLCVMEMVEEFPCVLHAVILLGGVESNLV